MKMGWALLGYVLFFSQLNLKAMERVSEALAPSGQSTAEEDLWNGAGGEAAGTHAAFDFSVGQGTAAEDPGAYGGAGGSYIDEWLERWRALQAHVEEPWPLYPEERLQWDADERLHIYAGTSGSFDELLQFIEIPGYPVDMGRTPHDPETALHAAARAGLFDHCVLLLIAGADPRRYDAAVLSFLLGEFSNGLTIFLIIFLMALFGFYQEFYADRTLQDLRARLYMHVRVVRNAEEMIIDAQELVCGDIVMFEPGDAICADMRLLASEALLVDEAALTGESQPVAKYVIDGAIEEEKYPQAILYAGTKVAGGAGRGLVIGVGAQTAFGKVVQAASVPARLSNFAQGLNSFSLFVLYFVGGTIGTIFISHLWLQGASVNILQLVVFYISLIVAVVPQALPVVINVALARAARSLAKRHVLVKRFASLEDLASVEILCVDKTGTLTENHLTVSNLWAAEGYTTDQVLLAAYQGRSVRLHKQIDSFDRALIEALNAHKVDASAVSILKQLPFDPMEKCNVTLVQSGMDSLLIIRGALEAVIKRCVTYDEVINACKTWGASMEAQGCRVLVIAEQENLDCLLRSLDKNFCIFNRL